MSAFGGIADISGTFGRNRLAVGQAYLQNFTANLRGWSGIGRGLDVFAPTPPRVRYFRCCKIRGGLAITRPDSIARLTTGGSVVQFAMPASARIVEVHDTAMKGGEANKAFPSYVCTVPRSICRALRINNEAYREEDHRSNKPDRCF